MFKKFTLTIIITSLLISSCATRKHSVLTTEDGKPITTESGKPIRTE